MSSTLGPVPVSPRVWQTDCDLEGKVLCTIIPMRIYYDDTSQRLDRRGNCRARAGADFRERRLHLTVLRPGYSRGGDRRSGNPTVILSSVQSAPAEEAPFFNGRFGGS